MPLDDEDDVDREVEEAAIDQQEDEPMDEDGDRAKGKFVQLEILYVRMSSHIDWLVSADYTKTNFRSY